MSGKKFDQGKPAMALIPPLGELECAKAMSNGLKYGKHQYLEGFEATRLVSAIKRHISEWMLGEECAPDSGVHHLGHAMAGCAMLIELEKRGRLIDDRHGEYIKALMRGTQPMQKPVALPNQDLSQPEPKVIVNDVNNSTPEEDFMSPPPSKKKLRATKWYLAARFPNGEDRISQDFYSTKGGAIQVAEEYTKAHPNCTFMVFQGKEYVPTVD